jgi:hypothetical protein
MPDLLLTLSNAEAVGLTDVEIQTILLWWWAIDKLLTEDR